MKNRYEIKYHRNDAKDEDKLKKLQYYAETAKQACIFCKSDINNTIQKDLSFLHFFPIISTTTYRDDRYKYIVRRVNK